MAFTDAQKDLVDEFSLQVSSSALLNPENTRAKEIQDAWRAFERACAGQDWDGVRQSVVTIAQSRGMGVTLDEFDADLFRALVNSDEWGAALDAPSIEAAASSKFRPPQADSTPAQKPTVEPGTIVDDFQRSMLALKKIGDENGNAKFGVEQLAKSLGVAGLRQSVQNDLLKSYLAHPQLLSKSHVNSTVSKLRELLDPKSQSDWLHKHFGKNSGIVLPFASTAREGLTVVTGESAGDAPQPVAGAVEEQRNVGETAALASENAKLKQEEDLRAREDAEKARIGEIEIKAKLLADEKIALEEEKRLALDAEVKRRVEEELSRAGAMGGGSGSGGSPFKGVMSAIASPLSGAKNLVKGIHDRHERVAEAKTEAKIAKIKHAYSDAPDHLAETLKSFSPPAAARLANANECALGLSAEVEKLRAHQGMRAIIAECQSRAGSNDPEKAAEFFEKLSSSRPESDDGKLNAGITRAFKNSPDIQQDMASFNKAFRKYKAAHGLAADYAVKEGEEDMLHRLNRINETTLQQASWIPGEEEKKREEYAKGLAAMAKRLVEMLKSAFGRKSGMRAA